MSFAAYRTLLKLISRAVLACFMLGAATADAAPRDDALAAYERRDYAKALELLIPLAEAGDADALANLGNMHAFGWGVPVDRVKAVSFWFKAAEKHVPQSMGNIASCYSTGTCGFERNDELAAQWLKRAAEYRHAPSMLVLSSAYVTGAVFPQDKVKGLAWAGLAVTNSLSPQITKAARDQTQLIMRQLTTQEVELARAYSNELLSVIDANVSKYRRQ